MIYRLLPADAIKEAINANDLCLQDADPVAEGGDGLLVVLLGLAPAAGVLLELPDLGLQLGYPGLEPGHLCALLALPVVQPLIESLDLGLEDSDLVEVLGVLNLVGGRLIARLSQGLFQIDYSLVPLGYQCLVLE